MLSLLEACMGKAAATSPPAAILENVLRVIASRMTLPAATVSFERQKASDPPLFWEGHDLGRATKPPKMCRALAPEVCSSRSTPVFPRRVRSIIAPQYRRRLARPAGWDTRPPFN